jgi:hypothetical protein
MRSWRDPVEAGVDRGARGHGFWAGGVGLDGCAPPEGAVGSDGVVVATELVEQGLELAEGGRAGLPVEPFLHGLVGTLDFPAGLRVVGPGVAEPDFAGVAGQLEGRPAAAGRR